MSVQPAGLRKVLKEGFAASLIPLGYGTNSGHRTWVRDTGELHHVIAVSKRWSSHQVQWGIVCPELVEIVWDKYPYKPFDVACSIVTGTPSSIRHPARAGFFNADLMNSEEGVADVIAGVHKDMAVVTEWLEPLVTRRSLRDYLLENREPHDRRAFVVPSFLGLKLFVAAGLAIVDHDPAGCDLLAEAEGEMQPLDDVARRRLSRLRNLAGGLCAGRHT